MKKIIFLGFSLLMLAACGGKDNVTLKDQLVIEYGAELKVEDLTEQEGISLKEVKEYDAKKIGEQKVIAIFTDVDEKEIEQEITLEVKDTQAPEITFKSETVEITLGDAIDTAANIESVKDPVDGDIVRSDDTTITENGYFVIADIKSEAGEYTVNVVAYDFNGKKSEKSYKLILKEKEQNQEGENQSVASNQGGSQTQTPSHNNGTVNNSGGQANSSNSGGSTTTPPKKVCPNGNEPLDPNLPCDAWHPIGLDQCYRDASGNIVAFPSSKTAANWAKEVMTNDRSFDIYSTFVTAPIAKNDGTEYYGITFMK